MPLAQQLPYSPLGAVSDVYRVTTRNVAVFTLRADTLNTAGIAIRPNEINIGAIWNYLNGKTVGGTAFPTNAIIEAFAWAPGKDSLSIQVYDPSATLPAVALNDVIPEYVI